MEILEQLKSFIKEDVNIDEVKNIVEKSKEGLISREALKKDYQDVLKEFPELQSSFDKYNQKGLDSWKTNNLDKIVQEKLNELNPPKTEAEKKLAELEQRILKTEQEKAIEKSRNEIYKKAKELKINDELLTDIDEFIGVDTEKNLKLLSIIAKAGMLKEGAVKEEFLKANGVKIEAGTGNTAETDEDYMRKKFQEYKR